MISAETKELLQDFEKRMRFVNIIKYWLQRSKPTEIREILHDDDQTDNLILMVLVFIMDSTLRYGERCTKQDITTFLRELSDVYGYSPEIAEQLADYIITDVLQNGGKIRLFDTYQSGEECFREQSSLILTEHQNGSYVLTNEAYEFLFRTKEIDNELDFSVNRFKLQEFIKRGNYSKALRESRELVSRVRNLETRMNDFILRCRTSISEVTIDEYDKIITQVKNSFEDENRQLKDIREVVSSRLQAITDISFGEQSDLKQTEREISEILENIDTVIDKQPRIFNEKFTLSRIYTQLLDESFSYLRSERFDFEQELIMPLQKLHFHNATDIGKLFKTLYKPSFSHLFSLDFFYEKQNEIRDTVKDNGIDIGSEEIIETDADRRNELYTEIVRSLLTYANEHTSFLFSDYLKTLSEETLSAQLQWHSLPNVILKLYAHNEVNVAEWREEHQNLIVPVGEFDLSYCLSNVPVELVQMKSIVISKTDDIVTFHGTEGRQIKINDFMLEVRR